MNAALLFLWTAAVSPGDDVVRKAMSDEMARTMKELQIPNEPRPHRVAYVVTDTEMMSGGATFGASFGISSRRWRTLRVEVRVGDRNFDSGNFVDNFASDSTSMLPVEDDPLALRRELWLRTDDAFKRAVDAIGRKRAAEKAQAKSGEEAPFDFAESKPVEGARTGAGPEALDPGALAKLATALSAVFREYPGIHSSRAGGEHLIVRQRLLTSDGSWKDERRSYVELAASAETQAEDGMRLRSWSTFQATDLAGLPPLADMTKTVRAMAADLTAARKAAIGDNGTAVVLFEGWAAGQLLRRLLGDHLSGTPPPRSARGGMVPASDLASKLGQRIAPPFLEVHDDPREPLGPGKVPLFGSYQIDDEGVPAERVSLVKNGMLESLLMSRTPRKEITRSNGHGRGRSQAGAVRGRVGVLYVSAGKAALSDQALRARAVKEAKAAGKEVPVYIVRHLDSTAPITGGEDGPRGAGVRPLIVVRLRDGKEEPVRGITFQNLLPRSLKDLVAVAKQPIVYNYLTPQEGPITAGGAPGTIVTPSVLFKDIEVKKDTDKNPRPPLYPHPSFAEK
ncbi:MAG TPA: metallopeptidase TldD-related protein [Polyangia bacterium]|nr:metallopeptidase TldD-related protein [Polyangia bacterium]